ncbi:MAG: hypothetical protein CM15mV18_0550 [uncultured marine virus]|nr:MAG: hypothetical protein CM15mV18_0550 [uncultured marine virus]
MISFKQLRENDWAGYHVCWYEKEKRQDGSNCVIKESVFFR